MSEDTDAFVIILNRQTFFFPENLNALAGQRQPFCLYKALSFQNLRHPKFLSNFQSPKFKFSVSGMKNVRLFDVMTKTSVLSEKNVPFLIITPFFFENE